MTERSAVASPRAAIASPIAPDTTLRSATGRTGTLHPIACLGAFRYITTTTGYNRHTDQCAVAVWMPMWVRDGNGCRTQRLPHADFPKTYVIIALGATS
jgi:hypothetical protein